MLRLSTPPIALCALLSLPGRALADGGKGQCIEAYENGQRAQKRGALVEARRELSLCSSEACPRAMHSDCAGWLMEVEAALPRQRVHVSGAAGEEVADVRVAIDGRESMPLDDEPLLLDPGEHELTLEAPGYRVAHVPLTARAGEAGAALEVTLEPSLVEPAAGASAPARGAEAPSPAVHVERPPNLLPTLIGAGVGVLGTASFVYFGLTARAADRGLDSCVPDCSPNTVSSIRRDYLLANVSIGIAAAGFAAAGISLLLQPSQPEQHGALRPLELRVGPVTSLRGEF